MNNQRRQIVVFAVGFSVASIATVFRFAILDMRSHDAISWLTTFGRNPKAVWGPQWQTTLDVFGSMAMAVFYSGAMLMVAAVLAWLFLPHRSRDERLPS
ncbi:MAG TPA: hypothetical protein VK530_02170 [Candidatus Acidoferrum sp.]|nr:hypothetical protein [Candidatus Acidoferrum sp.]